MPSTFSASLRLTLQATGENNNTWGGLLNTGALQLIDSSISGWTTKALAGDYSLTTANGAADEARSAMLKFTGTGPYNVTIPSVAKRYDVWNACTAALTITNGSASVTLQPGEVVGVVTDGASAVKRVAPKVFDTGISVTGASSFTGALNLNSSQVNNVTDPTSPQDAATKAYVDATAFNMAAGSLPGQTGNAGKFLGTNGSAASWSTDVSGFSASAADIRAGTNATKAVTAAALMASSAFQTLTDASTIAWDCNAGYNATVTLAASGHTIGAPTHLFDGLSVGLEIVQDGTGSRTVNWNAIWDFGVAGLPVLQTTAAKADRVFGQYNSRTGKIEASFRKGA